MDSNTNEDGWTAEKEDRTEPGLPPDPFHPEPRKEAQPLEKPPSKFRQTGIGLFAVFCFFFFLILKLPEARIQNYIIAQVRIVAQEQGYLFSAEKVRLGFLLGPCIKMDNVELKSIENDRDSLKIQYLKISPKLFSLLGQVKKIGIKAELLNGSLSGTVGGSSQGAVHVDLSLSSLDLGATSLLKKLLPVEARAKIDGDILIDFNPTDVQKSEGKIKLKLNELVVPSQNLSGFNLPKVQISESKIDLAIANGKLDIRDFEIGKDEKTDDLVGKVTGDGTLAPTLDRSTLNAKATFSLSQGVISSFPLLGAFLGPAKTADGKYSYRLTGPLSALEPVPGG